MDSNRLVMVNLDDCVDVPFWEALVNDVNRLGAPRIAVLADALVEVVNVLQSAIPNSRGLGIATSKTIHIAKRAGLADRLPGNPTEAEEAVAS